MISCATMKDLSRLSIRWAFDHEMPRDTLRSDLADVTFEVTLPFIP